MVWAKLDVNVEQRQGWQNEGEDVLVSLSRGREGRMRARMALVSLSRGREGRTRARMALVSLSRGREDRIRAMMVLLSSTLTVTVRRRSRGNSLGSPAVHMC
jgi:hypothetical protein